jgi:hypothetical protein
MSDAILKRRTMSEGVRNVWPDVQRGRRIADTICDNEVRKAVSQLSQDRNLPQSIRANLTRFWTNYRDMKTHTDEPQGTYQWFVSAARQLQKNHRVLGEDLKRALEITDE